MLSVHYLSQTFLIMKNKLTIVLATLATILTVSCNSLLEPEHANSTYLKGWIFRNCIDNDYRKSCVEDFGASDYDFSNPPKTLPEACLAFLAECTDDRYWGSNYETCTNNILDKARDIIEREQGFFDLLLGEWCSENIIKIFQQDPEATSTMLSDMTNQFFAFVENLAQSEVDMLNWQLNNDAIADTYTGYLVEYEIGSGFYVLLDLIEYDNEDRYTWEIVYTGNSLTELHQCYE